MVLVIISLVSAFVGSGLGGSMSNLSLKTATKKLASALRYARSQVTCQSVTYVVLLNFEARNVTVRAQEWEGAGEKETETPESDADPPERDGKGFQLSEGVRFNRAVSGEEEWDSGAFQLTFYPDGGSSGGKVFLTNGKHDYHVAVDFITGTVHVGSDER